MVELGEREVKLIVASASMVSFLDTFNLSMVNIALPSIASDLHTTSAQVTWIILIYGLMVASFLLTFGRLGDLRGLRSVLLLGFITFAAGSLFCSLSTGIYMLIGFRAVQGIGAAMMQGTAFAIITTYVPEKQVGKALGTATTFMAMGIAAGPLLGGFLCEYLGWRMVFFASVPVAVIGMVAAMRTIPRPSTELEKRSLDLKGAALIFCSLGTLTVVLDQGKDVGWGDPMIVGGAIISAAALILLYYHEKRAVDPIIDTSLFHNRQVLAAGLATMFVLIPIAGCFVVMPYYLNNVQALPVSGMGAMMFIAAMCLLVMGPLAGAASDRRGPHLICAIGLVTLLISQLFFWGFGLVTGMGVVMVGLILYGLGYGIFDSPVSALAMGNAPEGGEGSTAGLVSTMEEIGGTLGVVIFEVVYATAVGSFDPGSGSQENMLAGFHACFLVGAAFCMLALATIWLSRPRARTA
jgi:DHA2 family metal-tetracycline-proton antiporter-like MFS transporter